MRRSRPPGLTGGRRRPRPSTSPATRAGRRRRAHQQLGAARAHQPGDAEHLAARTAKLTSSTSSAPGFGSRDRHAAPRTRSRPVGGGAREEVVDLAADHPRDDVAPACRPRSPRVPTRAAVAQHGDAVGDAEDLFEACARCRSMPTPRARRSSRMRAGARRSSLGQRGRRLVEDQDARVLGERLRDLDQLLLADAEVADRARPDRREAKRVEQRAAPRAAAPPADDAEAAGSRPRKMFSPTVISLTSDSSWKMTAIPAPRRRAAAEARAPCRRAGSRRRTCRAGRRRRAPSSASTCRRRSRRTARAPRPAQIERDAVQRAHARERLVIAASRAERAASRLSLGYCRGGPCRRPRACGSRP